MFVYFLRKIVYSLTSGFITLCQYKMLGWNKHVFFSESRINFRCLLRKKLKKRCPLSARFVLVLLLIVLIFILKMGYKQLIYKLNHPPLRRIDERNDPLFSNGCKNVHLEAQLHPRMNATFVMLARNSDLPGVVSSINSLEKHFNRHFNYPYTFLNDEPFDEKFKETILKLTSANVEFGTLEKDTFGFPGNVDVDAAREAIASQGDRGIMYGDTESYHHMCRFFSGFFYKHPLLLKYQWYWRVEPDVAFTCDISYDPFYYMEENGKIYGYVVALKELEDTVPNLFRYTSAYRRNNNLTSNMWKFFLDAPKKENYDISRKDPTVGLSFSSHLNAMIDSSYSAETSSMEGESYNMCHFWSNFEIANFKFFRNEQYENFFRTMDATGGFWTERWGDAPFHSLAAGLFLSKEQVHYFRDLGYRHSDIHHCGQSLGCNCECIPELSEIESTSGGCVTQWVNLIGDGFLDE